VQLRTVGSSGLRISAVGLGTVSFGKRVDVDGARAIVDAALEEGVNFIDTADGYGEAGGSEEILGAALEGRREEFVLSTKFGANMRGAYGPDFVPRASRGYIARALEGSLRRLRTDYIDLYQMHFPDGVTPFEETLSALDDLVKAGKIRYVGASQLAGWQVVEADWVARDRRLGRFLSVQTHYSLLRRDAEAELVPACKARDVAILAYFPLAAGLLTGRWQRGDELPEGTRMRETRSLGLASDESADTIERLTEFAAEREISLIDVAIGGLLAQPAVAAVIAGATTPEHVRTNVRAADWVPRPRDLKLLDELAPTKKPQPRRRGGRQQQQQSAAEASQASSAGSASGTRVI
jgi:aryl-alcohol dehydrogenase-like predicted oxidoreductase